MVLPEAVFLLSAAVIFMKKNSLFRMLATIESRILPSRLLSKKRKNQNIQNNNFSSDSVWV
jgi:hypothetical protein